MRLICYPTSGPPPRIVPAPFERAWMGETNSEFAYRCLPLNIANAHGWIILNPTPFTAHWDGGPEIEAVKVESQGGAEPLLGLSHFGHGVLTFNVNGLFRTEPGYDLVVTGPLNQPKDAIQPLTGVVETDWSPFAYRQWWQIEALVIGFVYSRTRGGDTIIHRGRAGSPNEARIFGGPLRR
jgi:hypothetical protein